MAASFRRVVKLMSSSRCVLPRYITQSRMLHPSAFSSSGNRIEKHTIQDASTFLNNVLLSCKGAAIFAGTGQYHEEREEDRVIMLNFLDDFLQDSSISSLECQSLLDCCLNETDVDLLIDKLKSQSMLPVYNGELDIVDSSDWQNGFTLKPFSIFTADERILLFQENKLYLNSLRESNVIPAEDVEYVGLWVSEEPYNDRRLFLGLKGLQTRLLLSVERHNELCDLAQLTVDTEWMMKAAALLCVHISRAGNSTVYLKVSPCLQPTNNEWVAMRQKVWMQMIQKNTWGEKDE